MNAFYLDIRLFATNYELRTANSWGVYIQFYYIHILVLDSAIRNELHSRQSIRVPNDKKIVEASCKENSVSSKPVTITLNQI